MCGIAGIWEGLADESACGLVSSMMEQMAHRGPDAAGTYVSTNGVVGHRRLSIVDLESGDQPITDESGKRAIVANGEIYNFESLRRRLSKTRRFKTRSDTEAALHLYDALGKDVASRLDGMFAVAITDGSELFLARDPIGIKPLYYAQRDGKLVFASELKALDGNVEYAHEFPPGTWYRSDKGFHRYYELPHGSPTRCNIENTEDLCRQLRTTLERAVKKRLMSDVPVGCFLSGGVDSSIITAIARRHLGRLHTFSVGIEGSADIEAARLVSRHLDTIHHEYLLSPYEVVDELPKIIYHLESFDQDLVRSAIPCYFTARLASDYVKVVLTGEGADELFAGYHYYEKDFDRLGLGEELRRSVDSMHNINLQRVDRMTMVHSIEGRVPYLDVSLIELALGIPAEHKLYSTKGTSQTIEKWILRRACEDLLPPEILWRKKEQFDEGSGTVQLLEAGLERFSASREVPTYRNDNGGAGVRSAEERVYHRLLTEAFTTPEIVLGNVVHWSDRPGQDEGSSPRGV
jgi:asparagine synthase (glutamine-hydrolysing)